MDYETITTYGKRSFTKRIKSYLTPKINYINIDLHQSRNNQRNEVILK